MKELSKKAVVEIIIDLSSDQLINHQYKDL